MLHKLAWLGHTRLDLVSPINILSQITAETFDSKHIFLTNRFVDRARVGGDRGIIEWDLNK